MCSLSAFILFPPLNKFSYGPSKEEKRPWEQVARNLACNYSNLSC
mgnify:CR=1 FL=1